MSFPRARIRRFNEEIGCAPGVGHYDPKYSEKAKLWSIDKSQRFRDKDEHPDVIHLKQKGSARKFDQNCAVKKNRSLSCPHMSTTCDSHVSTSDLQAVSDIIVIHPPEENAQNSIKENCEENLDVFWKENLELSQENLNIMESKQTALKRLSDADDEIFHLQLVAHNQRLSLDLKVEECLVLEKRISELSLELEATEKSLNYKTTQHQILVQKVEYLTKQNNNLIQRLDEESKIYKETESDLNSKLACLKTELEEKALEFDALTLRCLDLARAKSKIQLEYEEDLMKSNHEIEILSCQLKSAEAEVHEARDLVEELKKVTKEKGFEIQRLNTCLPELNTKVEELTVKNENLELELTKTIKGTNIFQTQNSELQYKLENFQAQIVTKDSELLHLKTCYDELNTKFEESSLKNRNLESELSALGLELTKFFKDCNRLQSQNSELQYKLEISEAQVVTKDSEVLRLNTYSQELNSYVEELGLKNENLGLELTKTLKDANVLQTQNSYLEYKLEMSQAQVATKDLICNEKNAEIRELLVGRDRLTSDNDLLVKRLDQHKDQLYLSLKEKDCLIKSDEEYGKRIFQFEKEVEENKASIEELKCTIVQKDKNETALTKLNNELQKNFDEQEAALQKLAIEKYAGERNAQEMLQEKEDKIQKLQDHIKESDLSALEKELKSMNAKLECSNSTVMKLQEELSDELVLRKELEQEVQKLWDKNESWKSKYENLLADILPFKEILDDYAREKALLLNLKDEAVSELQELSSKCAKNMGHQNHKQKIQYLSQLQEKYFKVKGENVKLKEQLAKQQRDVNRILLDGNQSVSDITPSKPKAEKSKTPAKIAVKALLPMMAPPSVLKGKENIEGAFF